MLGKDVKYYVVKDFHEYGHILNNVFYEYTFGRELPIEIRDGKIIQGYREGTGELVPTVVATIEGNKITNLHGAVFQLQTEKP